jgi:hypothetical protein
MAMNITIPKNASFFLFSFFLMNRKIINETNQQIQLKRQKPKIKDPAKTLQSLHNPAATRATQKNNS